MKIIETLCEKGKEYNEDYIGYGENYAFVLDGATGLSKNIISNKSDAAWYIEKFSSYLNKYIIEDNSKEAIKNH